MFEIPCTSCGRKLRVQPEWVGRQIKCPQCNTVQKLGENGEFVPQATPPASPAGSTPSVSWSNDPGSPFSSSDAASNKFRDAGNKQTIPEKSGGEFNPYASPKTSYEFQREPGFGGREWVHRQVETGTILERSWNVFVENIGPCLLVGLVLIAQNIAVQMGFNVISMVAQQSDNIGIIIGTQLLGQIAMAIIGVWFQIGLAIFCIKLARGENATVGDLFASAPFMGGGIIITLVVTFTVFGIALACLLPAGIVALVQGLNQVNRDPGPVAIVAIIGILPMAFLINLFVLNWFVAMVMMIDRQLPAMEALSQSTKYMYGNRLATFLTLMIVGILGGLATICTCGIGALAYAPFLGLVSVIVYFSVTGQPIHRIGGRFPPKESVGLPVGNYAPPGNSPGLAISPPQHQDPSAGGKSPFDPPQ